MLSMLWLMAITFSIVVAETALWLAAVAWGTSWLLRETGAGARPPAAGSSTSTGDLFGLVVAPIVVFFALSLLSVMASRDRVEGLFELREIFLFAAPIVTWALWRDPDARARGLKVFAVGIFAALFVGLYQAAVMTPAPGDAIYRATGPLGHYMTFSGVLLVSIPALLTIRGRIGRVAGHLVAGLAIAMIGLTLTRSAWIGCGTALVVFYGVGLIPARQKKSSGKKGFQERPAHYAISLVVALVVITLFVSALAGPDSLLERAASTFSMENPNDRDRLAMAATGLKIIKAHPLLGIGPGLMERVYPAWVVDWGFREQNPHLHNNLLQIAAERGLLGLSAWLWMMAAFGILSWRILRSVGATGPGGPEASAALASLAGFLAMGMFEYNFSDSEVLMALLYVVSLPLAAETRPNHHGATR
ncbi:MAG: hypothetical protein CL475_02125 [Acidobacteria bacterium]|jgi:O-antigen ligase|nr:hypothetical protein [Acidobacteriota bacterium]|tara:strand:- start:1237 stop:2490 length:1254 start_codon:yes stop_codon:yes gene_type:complete